MEGKRHKKKKRRNQENRQTLLQGYTYILASQKNSSLPPSKGFPCVCGFFAVFKLHKDIFMFYHSFLFFLFSPLFPSFFQVLLQILPCFFNLDKISPPPLGMARIYFPVIPLTYAFQGGCGWDLGRREGFIGGIWRRFLYISISMGSFS